MLSIYLCIIFFRTPKIIRHEITKLSEYNYVERTAPDDLIEKLSNSNDWLSLLKHSMENYDKYDLFDKGKILYKILYLDQLIDFETIKFKQLKLKMNTNKIE